MPTDPTTCFNILLKLIRRLQFERMMQGTTHRILHDSDAHCTATHSYEMAVCDLGESLLLRRLAHQRSRDMSSSSPTATACMVPLSYDPRLCQQSSHLGCPSPAFPNPVVAALVEFNHVLQTHLVTQDALVPLVEQAIRRAMLHSVDFAVVLGRVLAEGAARGAVVTAAQTADIGYVLQPVDVTFTNLHPSAATATATGGLVRWRVRFPSRKLFAAFLANKPLWVHLRHVPLFNYMEVGPAADLPWRRATVSDNDLRYHGLSPHVAAVLPHLPRLCL